MYNKAQRTLLSNYTVGSIENPARISWIAWFFELLD